VLGSVLIRRCSSPLSPIALRAALMRVVTAVSETTMPTLQWLYGL
jgi:hypothetical protein